MALARAIIREPNVFLFDEPLSNLDAELRLEMRGELKYLQRQLGTTAIYVTHDQAEALAMADRITVMREAKVLQVGSPMDIYDRPAKCLCWALRGEPGDEPSFRPVADQERIGSRERKRLLLGRSRRRGQRGLAPTPRRPAGDRGRAFPRRWNSRLASRRATPRPPSSRSRPLGSEVLVDVLLDKDTRIKARAETTFTGEPGDVIWVRPKPDRIRLFDGESQEAIE